VSLTAVVIPARSSAVWLNDLLDDTSLFLLASAFFTFSGYDSANASGKPQNQRYMYLISAWHRRCMEKQVAVIIKNILSMIARIYDSAAYILFMDDLSNPCE